MTDSRALADTLYALFRNEILGLGATHRPLFMLMNCGVTTLALLCTGLLCTDGDALLHGMDALSLECAREERAGLSDECALRQGRAQIMCGEEYEAFRRDCLTTIAPFRGRTEWYKTPPGLCTALYLAFRLKHQTIQCSRFEKAALALVETTSFRCYAVWYPWICGIKHCSGCQKSGASLKLTLCQKCQNVYYCSLRCVKQDRDVHMKYCPSVMQTRKRTPILQ